MKYYFYFLSVIFFFSCKNEDNVPEPITVSSYASVLIGNWKDENSTYTQKSDSTYILNTVNGQSMGKWYVSGTEKVVIFNGTGVTYHYNLSAVYMDSYTE
jgi:filamentous hemagglutinin family protein